MKRDKTTRTSASYAPPSSDMIRIAIDRGLEGDKIAHPDTAATPLGTGSEAAGAPPTREERAIAARRPKVAACRENPSPRGEDAILSWKTGLPNFVFALVVGALLVSLRL